MGDAGRMSGAISCAWRDPITDEEMVDLVRSHGGTAVAGWWRKVGEHSLGWVGARDGNGLLVGFVNVAWDGGDHAFLIDTKTRGSHQRRGIGSAVVRLAVAHAREAACEWLHVDFEPHLRDFYFDACGFRPTEAGLVHLPSARDVQSGSAGPMTSRYDP
jgi:GNAT superfamily N-acetyltransferase